ncbi:site-specific DNA-methyltransferase [Sarcina ventriculi]|uniref:site-specific DNA-methyltransferase n=1 Tax=Sarcina ventriculi TaxID=1267 RepID=UPI001C120189|nr:site-specific DNA-methyltransferase [Sarcina ventriculi]MBU5322068.1 site-specific DNA-methyltransferase [Sarcina ventriculi]
MNVKLGVKKDLKQEIFNSVNENVKALENLFPSVVKDGQVDFEALKEELGQFEEVDKEKYELTWSGKQNAKKQAQQDILGKTLKYIPEDSKNPETTKNLYIEGDNLEVLKLLRQNYYGSIKMIYIDPPYNTGNDFIYNDKFSMSKEESDIQDGTASELGERYTVNKDTSNRYHASWLNMMYPRLKVAKDLLTEDGVIFISIDENEINNFKKMCDELFGEINFVETLIWSKNATKNNTKTISTNHEYILVYCKNKEILVSNDDLFMKNKDGLMEIELLQQKYYEIQKNTGIGMHKELQEELKKFYKKNENNLAGGIKNYNKIEKNTLRIYRVNNTSAPSGNGKIYDVIHPYTGKKCKKPAGGWRYTKETFDEMVKNNLIEFGINEETVPQAKLYLDEYKKQKYQSVINNNDDGEKDISKIFNHKYIFSNPKPISLLKELISISTNKYDLILDFFSGSSSSAHAVIQLNAEDGGNRKFIMVQLPEECDEKSEAYKAGYKNICEIGKERIRRAGEKIKEENKDKEGIENLDIGFKVFRVGDTNIRWNYETVNSSTLNMFKNIENSLGEEVATKAITPLEEEYYRNKDGVDFMPKAKDTDIVYEILLRQRDIHLSEKVELLSDIGERTYLFADSYLVCLEKTITKELIEKIASIEPLPIKFVFRDSAFEDNISLKDEAIRRLKALIDKNSEGNKVVYTVEFI